MRGKRRTDQTIYVYVDRRADDGTPFYVGKGLNARVKKRERNVIHSRIVAKHGMIREIVKEFVSNQEACDLEVQLIREFQTRNYCGGANMTDGGEGTVGWHPSEVTRQKQRARKLGKKLSPMHRVNQSLAHIQRYVSQEERDKTSLQWLRVWSDPAYHVRMQEIHNGEGNSQVILTTTDVIEIRQSWTTTDVSKRGAIKAFCLKWAQKFDVTKENIYGIVTRRSWRHLP
jgi:hypothetical protein